MMCLDMSALPSVRVRTGIIWSYANLPSTVVHA